MPSQTAESVSLDFNKIAALTAQGILENMASRLAEPLSRQLSRVRHSFTPKLGEYIQDTLKRLSVVRTIIHSGEDTLVDSIYVAPSFDIEDRRRSEAEVIRTISSRGRAIVSGTAGGGKSIFVKRLTCQLLQNYAGTLPVHYELREFNDSRRESIIDEIFHVVSGKIPTFSREIFDSELKTGNILLILDGFDEINHDIRDSVARELSQFAEINNKSKILITTRPEENLESLPTFRVCRVLPMTKAQCVSLLGKIDYDPRKKSAFIKRVKETLYESHKDFLSNPLLASMMLMTFSEAGEIPSKTSTFYKQAFEVLFYKHDRSKGVYTRRSYSELAIDEFERLFAFFCAASYADERFTFGDIELREYIKRAIVFEGAGVNSEDVINDLLRSVCLLQRDGLQYSFVHRSFQEYFAATFIARQDLSKAKMALDSVLQRASSDKVLALCHQIDRDLFEAAWVFPWIVQIKSDLEPGPTVGRLKSFYSVFWRHAMITRDSIQGFVWDEVPMAGQAYHAIEMIYSNPAVGPQVKDREIKPDPATFRLAAQINERLPKEIIDFIEAKTVENEDRRSAYRSVPIDQLSEQMFEASALSPWAIRMWEMVIEIHDTVGSRLASKSKTFMDLFG